MSTGIYVLTHKEESRRRLIRIRELESEIATLREQQATMRLQYAGAIGLLADVMPHVPDAEQRDCVERACRDWGSLTGWIVRRILNRMDLAPPKIEAGVES